MADFFSALARQMLGTAPEAGPLLPPRFASWPDVPLTGVAPRPQELADAPARADAALFPPPLIDPDGPAADAPLPTFRQMSELRSVSGPPVQPGQTRVAQDRPETADFEQGDIRQAVAMPVRTVVDDAPSHPPPTAPASSPTSPAAVDEPATPPVIQAEADSDTDGAVIASPAPTGASGDWPFKEVATTERDQAVPPPPSPAPAPMLRPAARPAAGQERSASFARLPDSPANVGRLLRYSQAEPVEARSEPVEGHAELVEARRADMPVQPLAPQPAPAAEPALPVSTQVRATPTTTSPALITGSLEPTPPAGCAVPSLREPAIVSVPEPAPGEMWSTTQTEAVAVLRPAAARPKIGEPEPVPTVCVTIGRVVVQAAPVAERPPSRRIELPRPPLSLEEYLQGRQGAAALPFNLEGGGR